MALQRELPRLVSESLSVCLFRRSDININRWSHDNCLVHMRIREAAKQRANQHCAHNHRAWIAILIALLMHETAYGRLGETLEQSIARYGKEIYLGEEERGTDALWFPLW